MGVRLEGMQTDLTPQGERALVALLRRIAAAYTDDPCTWDLDDEQPAYSVLNLGDVRLARELVGKE